MKKLLILLICATSIFSACSSLGPSYNILKDKLETMPTGSLSRIVVLRTTESYSCGGLVDGERINLRGAEVPIDIDGQKIGSVICGSFLYKDIDEGKHIIKTEKWNTPGKCEITLNIKSKNIYYFQVDPRPESAWASTAGILLLGGAAGSVIGSAVESYGKECGGAFSLYAVDEQTAKSKLPELRLSQ